MLDENNKILDRDKTITGKILSYSSSTKTYTVQYLDSEIQLKSRDGLTLNTGDIVYIRLVQGNFNERFIDCKKP